MIRKISRRHFLRALTFAGAAGAFAAQPVSSLAGAISQTAPVLTETRILMGTLVAVSVSDPSRARMEDALYAAFGHMETLIPFFDRHAVDSVLSVLNRQGALQDVPPELSALLARTRAMSALTQGAFNPTVQPLVDFFCSQAVPDGRLNIPESALNEVRALLSPDGRSGWTADSNGVRLERRGMGLTLDGIAKGRVADLVSRKLKQEGMVNHLINAGGDIVASGEKAPGIPWQVAVSNPSSPHSGHFRHGRPFALKGKALATSGSYEHYYDAEQKYNHIIDAGTGISPVEMVSASVIAPDATDADALATAFSVMPPRESLKLAATLPECECLLISRGGRIFKSRGWPA